MSNQPINDGGPAFPTMDPNEHYRLMGMTLRDYFAAAALQGMLSDSNTGGSDSQFAESAYAYADAMLKARGYK